MTGGEWTGEAGDHDHETGVLTQQARIILVCFASSHTL
jgi:hypothetical protein